MNAHQRIRRENPNHSFCHSSRSTRLHEARASECDKGVTDVDAEDRGNPLMRADSRETMRESAKACGRSSVGRASASQAEYRDSLGCAGRYEPIAQTRTDDLNWRARHSHSMVAGGLEEMSKHTRLMPRTSLMMRVLMRRRTSTGSSSQSAVMASVLDTTRTAQAFS